jgi:hypothetical protein
MAKLLIDEPPLQLLPTLAALIGLNEAIVIQQLHYRLQLLRESREDRKCVCECYEDWRQQFPFWSASTIKRAFISLEKKGLITSRQFEKNERSMRKRYSINYTALEIIGAFSVTTRNGPNCPGEADPYEALQHSPLPRPTESSCDNPEVMDGSTIIMLDTAPENMPETTPRKPAGGLSQHSLENCRKYARWLHATNQGIKKPEAFAIACWRTAFADDRISDFLASSYERGSAACPAAVAPQSAGCLECGRAEACSDNYLDCSLALLPEGIFEAYKAAR